MNYNLPSASEMAAYDAETIASGISSQELMQRAGIAMFEVLRSKYLQADTIKKQSVCILCGPGNNGGDGFVVARQLRRHLGKLMVIVAESARYSADHIIQAKAFLAEGGEIFVFSNTTAPTYVEGLRFSAISKRSLQQALSSAYLIVDALLGTGQRDKPSETIAHLITLAMECKSQDSKIISLDVPTGVSATTGEVFAPHIEADLTITVQLIKRGMLQYPARTACGEIHSVPVEIDCSRPSEFKLLTDENIAKLPLRASDGHKGNYGHILAIGGSVNLPGAPVLSAQAALRCGAGLVTLAKLSSFPPVSTWPELMFKVIESKEGYFKETHVKKVIGSLEKNYTLVLGPGLGQNKASARFIGEILDFISETSTPAVIDADGLNLLATISNGRKTFSLPSCVLTPHPAEAGRLLAIDTKEVQRDRFSAVRSLAEKFSCCAVLKGAGTLVYSGDRGALNLTGNPYMATAGSGDVLSGVIAALMAQGLNIASAAELAVFIHGKSADIAYKKTLTPLIASDLIEHLPLALVGKI